MVKGRIHSISTSPERGRLKKEVPEATLIENFGIEGDGHSGNWGRQISCLSWHSVQKVNTEHSLSMGPGDFAENLLIDELDLSDVKIGQRFTLATDVILEVTQIGKEDGPSIVSKTFGVSLLPTEGLFCRVVKGGRIRKGDSIEKL